MRPCWPRPLRRSSRDLTPSDLITNLPHVRTTKPLTPRRPRPDEAHLPRVFTAAHLFIDDCPDATITCGKNAGDDSIGELGQRGTCDQWQGLQCLPCDGDAAARAECNATSPACNGQCIIHAAF